MKLSFLAGMMAAVVCSPALSAQTFFSFHAGSDGVGVDVSNVNPYFPVVVAPSHPVSAVHIPLMPGFYPEPPGKSYRKAAKEYRKAAKHYRKAMEHGRGIYAIPVGMIYIDDDDMEDYYEDYYKHLRKNAKKHHKSFKRQHKKYHHKHHHHDD